MWLLTFVAYAFALWLGLYLLSRNAADSLLRATGAGLIIYALALAAETLQPFASGSAAVVIARFARPLLFLPALFWLVAVVHLSSSEDSRLQSAVDVAVLPLAVLLYLLTVALGSGPASDSSYLLLGVPVLLALLVALLFALRSGARSPYRRATLVLTLFFALAVGLLLTPLQVIPQPWLTLAIAADLLLLGVLVARYDAFGGGEQLWPDFWRSLDYAFFTALFFGAQVALVMWLDTGLTMPMLVLLLLTVGSAIFLQTWGPSLASIVDRVALARFPQLRRERSALRAESGARTRLEGARDPAQLSQEEFARLTRRAYSQMGNLPRLASNPLTRLDLVTRRLEARDAADTALERAAELRQLLIEGAVRLKPREQEEFGTTDEWRHYNALYFPYVAGLKPYSRRATHDDREGVEAEALQWFRSQVPARTLYNWQTAAARLVARDLRQRGEIGD